MVSLSSFDRDTGLATLAIDAGVDGDADKALIAAWNPGDAGADATAWRETAYVGSLASGTTEVTYTIPADWRAKSGAVRFFLMERTAPYVSRYACITGTPGPWIDTGIIPTTNTDIRVTATHPMDMAPFGVSTRCYLFSNDGDGWGSAKYHYGFFGVSGSVEGVPRGTAPREHWLNATGAYIDGVRYVTFDPAKFTEPTAFYTLTLFGRRDNTNGSIGKQRSTCSIYSARIDTNGAPAHVYVPCRSPENIVTLYDRVTGMFAEVKGSGSFSAGTEVCPAPEDCGVVESATDAITFAPAITVVSRDIAQGTMTLAFSEGHDEGLLLAVADGADRGTTLASWTDSAFIAKVPAESNTVTVTLPQTWWNAGKQMRFLWASAVDCPYDYPVEWLYTAGSAYANFGWIPTPQTEIAVCAKSPADVCHFGVTVYFYLFCNGGSTFYGYFGNVGSFAAYNSSSSFRELRLGPSGAYLDGVQKAAFTTATYQALGKATSVPFRRDWTNGGLTKTGNCWVKYAKLWERGRLVVDCVPCVKGGVAGFWDRVQGKFYGSAVSAQFTAGDVVFPVSDDGEVLTWSEPISLALDTSVAWDGGGADNAFTTAANWVGDVLPDFANGSAFPSFATYGDAAVLTAPAMVRGLKFNARNDFQISASAPGAALTIGPGGITMENNPAETLTTWRQARFACPIVLADDQTWDLSANTQRRVQLTENADLQGASNVTLTVTGKGVLGLAGVNSFAGDVRLEGGMTKVLAKERPFGTAAEGGKVYVDLSKDATFEMYGGVIDKPLVVTGGNELSARFACNDYSGATNYFLAPISVVGARLLAKVEAPTVFAGGGAFAGMCFTGSGPVVFRDTPIRTGAWFDFWGTRDIHFMTPSNRVPLTFDGTWGRGASVLHLWADYVFYNYDSWLKLAGSTKVDLHGHPQNFGDVEILGGGCRVTSGEPADFFAFNNTIETTFYGVFEGQVNLVKSGGKRVELASRSTSTGFLRVQNGPFTILSNACWSGTSVYVGAEATNRKPSLRLRHSDCFADPRNTTLTLTTTSAAFFKDYAPDANPVISLDEGVRQIFGEVWLDGRRLAGGTWGSSESPASHKDDVHFSGKGVIFARGEGSVIVVR